MNKKLLSLLFLAPCICVAQSENVYNVLGFAKQVSDVAVASKDDGTHDFSIVNAREQGWYVSAKIDKLGVSRDNETKFRLVKTAKDNVFKLFCVNNNKFVAFTDTKEGRAKTKFVDSETEANTDWHIVPNMGGNGRENKFDILPGTVDAKNPSSQSWNVYGGMQDGAGVIGHYRANDNGSAWCFEGVVTQQLKFHNSYSESNESYFMTIRGRYVHKDGDKFTADYNLQFGDKKYLFQLVGNPQEFKIYNVETGLPIGTKPQAGLNAGDKEDNNLYRPNEVSTFSAQSSGGRVYVKEKRGENIYLNFREPNLSTWHHPAAWNSRDEGSQILFTTEDGILAEAAKKLETETRTNYPDSKFGDELGQYSAESKAARDAVLEALKKAQDPSLPIQKKKELYQAAQGFSEALTLNMPKDGDLLYLTFKRDGHTSYLTSALHVAGDKDYDNKSSENFLTTKSNKSNDAVFYYKEVDGKATLVSVTTGRRVIWGTRAEDSQSYPTMQAKAGEGTKFTVSARDGKFAFEDNGKYLASDANLTYATAFNNFNATFAGVTLERVKTLPFTIGPSGFSSFWSPVQYTLPEGVTACRLEVEGGKVKLSPVEGNTVPKNTAVILKGAANETVQLTLVPEGTAAELTGNLLMGGAEPKALDKPVYALKKSAPSFIKVSDYMPAFKAYFTATENQVRELLERGLTGVVSVATEAEVAPVYDLSGRRVQQTTKGGVYVTGGKKIIAK